MRCWDGNLKTDGDVSSSSYCFAATGGEQSGTLKITVAEARGLPIMDSATKSSDPFAKLSLGEQSEKTETVKKTLEPKWNQEFTLCVRLC